MALISWEEGNFFPFFFLQESSIFSTRNFSLFLSHSCRNWQRLHQQRTNPKKNNQKRKQEEPTKETKTFALSLQPCTIIIILKKRKKGRWLVGQRHLFQFLHTLELWGLVLPFPLFLSSLLWGCPLFPLKQFPPSPPPRFFTHPKTNFPLLLLPSSTPLLFFPL